MSANFPARLKRELIGMLALATPVVLAQLTQMLMMISDTVMVGRLGASELAAVSVSTNIIFFLAVAVWMSLAAINPVVAHHFGAGEHEEIRKVFSQTLWMGGLLALPVLALMLAATRFMVPHLPLGQAEQGFVRTYITVYSFSMLPLMGYFALRYFLEGLGRTKANLFVTVLGVPVNILGNYALIFGNFGAPKLGVGGAALVTGTVNCLMFLGLLVHVLRDPSLRRYTGDHGFVPPDRKILGGLLKIGLPMGGAVFAEVSAFTSLGVVMTWFGTEAVAANQIVMNVVSTAFMVPLGLSAAIAARSGQFLGGRNPAAARFSAWTGIGLGVAFMAAASVVLYFARHGILKLYTDNPAVIAQAGAMLLFGVFFLVFDGTQVTVMGALRGRKDTTVPMIICSICYWGGGFVPALVLAFGLGWGPMGIWAALPPCLFVTSVCLTTRFVLLSRRDDRALPDPQPMDAEEKEELEEPCLAG